jgi:MFS family permease
MFAPGIPGVLADFHSDSVLLASFVVSVYLIGYSFGPLICAPM